VRVAILSLSSFTEKRLKRRDADILPANDANESIRVIRGIPGPPSDFRPFRVLSWTISIFLCDLCASAFQPPNLRHTRAALVALSPTPCSLLNLVAYLCRNHGACSPSSISENGARSNPAERRNRRSSHGWL